MPSPLSADHPAAQPSGPGTVEALISQTRRLKGEVDAVRRDARHDGSDPTGRWQRALYDLALHQLDDVDRHLAQLRDGPPLRSAPAGSGRAGSSPGLVGSAEWDLLTDGAHWSPELYRILGRDPAAAPLTLDELPSVVLAEDRPGLTAMVTGCLVDARPIDGEFRVVRPDGTVRTVHMRGRPVLDAHGSTVSLWAVLRDVTALRRGRRAVSESRASLPDPASAAPARPAAPHAGLAGAAEAGSGSDARDSLTARRPRRRAVTIAQHRPQRDGGAMGVEDGPAPHVHGPYGAVGPDDTELAVDRAGVDETPGDHRGQAGPVLRQDDGRQFVEGERGSGGVPAEDAVQLRGPVGPVRQQIPLRAADQAGRRAGPAGTGGRRPERRAVPQLRQVPVDVVQLMQRQIVQGALPAARGVRSVVPRVPPYGVHLALEPPRLRYQRLHRAGP
ncbi:hypothetical protein Sdagh_48780 [Streptomyces daghestanicus]|uniref:histidine kinase n=1 Tax=Streptomyces daghestanicus TaxID=66885 RepID=A0ABQ3Q796_9ACTN|nr:hypothetical protein Sdagh_48780 [Streptomyces daghestanicus]